MMDETHNPVADDSLEASSHQSNVNTKDSDSSYNSASDADDKAVPTKSDKYANRLEELKKRRLQISEKSLRWKSNPHRKGVTGKDPEKDQMNAAVECANVSLESSDVQGLSCSSEKSEGSKDNSTWLDLKPFLKVNDHLDYKSESGQAKSGLEKKIEEAVLKKNYDEAVELSDQLANRNFGRKIVTAIDAKEFLKKRKKEEEDKARHHKKKLSWGFEHKQRWETKGNM